MLENIANAFEWNTYGFELVQIFTSAKSALTYVNDNDVDCIISDIKMPELNGFDFCKLVKEKLPNIPFVFLTAYSIFEYLNCNPKIHTCFSDNVNFA